MVWVHVRLNFENKAAEAGFGRFDFPFGSAAGSGFGGQIDETVQERFDTEVGNRRTEEDGGEFAGIDAGLVEWLARDFDQLDLVA